MMICDAHSDALLKRAIEPDTLPDITLERLLKNGVSLQTLALFCGREPSVQAATTLTKRMLQVFRRLKREDGWQQLTDPAEARAGDVQFLLSLEGAEVLTPGLHMADEYHALGVRMASLTWNHENAFASPNGAADGLKPFGLKMVRRMQALHIAIDISHLNDAGVDDILQQTDVPPLASHSACRALTPHTRNLHDGHLKALFAAGGFVGVVFCPAFLGEGEVTIDRVIDHIDHMMAEGGEGKVGFGSDFDGIRKKVRGLESPAGYPALLARLAERGYRPDQIESLAGRAFIDYFARIARY